MVGEKSFILAKLPGPSDRRCRSGDAPRCAPVRALERAPERCEPCAPC